MEWDLADAYQQPNAIQKIKPATHSRLVCMTYSLTTRNTTAKFYHEDAASIEFNENNETDQKKILLFSLDRRMKEAAVVLLSLKAFFLALFVFFFFFFFFCLFAYLFWSEPDCP